MNFGLIVNQQLKSSLTMENSKPRKPKERQDEINRLVAYLNEHLHESWARCVRTDEHIKDFNRNIVLHKMSVTAKLKNAQDSLGDFVKRHLPTLNNTDWPEELEGDDNCAVEPLSKVATLDNDIV